MNIKRTVDVGILMRTISRERRWRKKARLSGSDEPEEVGGCGSSAHVKGHLSTVAQRSNSQCRRRGLGGQKAGTAAPLRAAVPSDAREKSSPEGEGRLGLLSGLRSGRGSSLGKCGGMMTTVA